jgi:hypothetical protein
VISARGGTKFSTKASRGRDRGKAYALGEMDKMEQSGQDFPSPCPETFAVLERISGSCRIRCELDLPRDSCAKPEDGTVCSCQTQAIDELLDEGAKPTRRRIAQLARQRHCSKGKLYIPPKPKPKPWPKLVPLPELERPGGSWEPTPERSLARPAGGRRPQAGYG